MQQAGPGGFFQRGFFLPGNSSMSRSYLDPSVSVTGKQQARRPTGSKRERERVGRWELGPIQYNIIGIEANKSNKMRESPKPKALLGIEGETAGEHNHTLPGSESKRASPVTWGSYLPL